MSFFFGPSKDSLSHQPRWVLVLLMVCYGALAVTGLVFVLFDIHVPACWPFCGGKPQ